MSSVDGNGKGNLLISYLFKSDNFKCQIDEENQLKKEIAQLMTTKGYKFVIADDALINAKLIKD